MKFSFCKILTTLIFLVLSAGFSFAQSVREKGIELYQNGDYKAAIEILQRVVEADENDGMAWRFLGMAYARTNNEEQSRKTFDKADDFRDEDLNKTYDIPIKFIKLPKNNYTKKARQNNVKGRVKLAVEFRFDGKIGFIFPIKELPDGLTESAVKAANSIEFEPAVKNGRAVTVIKFVEYIFSIY